MRVKGSALHLVIVLALIVSILISTLIYVNYFYRSEHAKLNRWNILYEERNAAILLSLSEYFPHTSADSLLSSPIDSDVTIHINKRMWGLFDVSSIINYRATDTMKTSFMAGVGASDSVALYITDEERPVFVSGKTTLEGTVYLPASGISPAFVDGEYYEGMDEIVLGDKRNSQPDLPLVDENYIDQVRRLAEDNTLKPLNIKPKGRVLKNSFFDPIRSYKMSNHSLEVDSVIGNIIIYCDTLADVSATVTWQDAILIAPAIRLAKGFNGRGQFFATDSLIIGEDVELTYPTVLGVTASETNPPGHILVKRNSRIRGLIFNQSTNLTDSPSTMIEFDANVSVVGQVVSFGVFKYSGPITIHGGLYCRRVLTERPSSLYENYLINLSIESGKLPAYFVFPNLWDGYENKRKERVVTWLN